jgi:hypothetical protein
LRRVISSIAIDPRLSADHVPSIAIYKIEFIKKTNFSIKNNKHRIVLDCLLMIED